MAKPTDRTAKADAIKSTSQQMKPEIKCLTKEAGKLFLASCPFDHCPGVMIVYGLKIHGLDSEPFDEFVGGCFLRNAANKILDENGVVVCALRHGFFIRALKQAVEFTAGTGFNEFDKILDPDRLMKAD